MGINCTFSLSFVDRFTKMWGHVNVLAHETIVPPMVVGKIASAAVLVHLSSSDRPVNHHSSSREAGELWSYGGSSRVCELTLPGRETDLSMDPCMFNRFCFSAAVLCSFCFWFWVISCVKKGLMSWWKKRSASTGYQRGLEKY